MWTQRQSDAWFIDYLWVAVCCFTSALPQRANSARKCQNNLTGQSNQSRRGLAFTDAATKRQINERERGKMEAANHLMFSQLFYRRNVKWLTIIFSEANYLTFFSNMPILRVREIERDREREMKCVCVNYLHLFVSSNNETVNLVLLQKHVYYYCWKIINIYFF